MNWEHVQGKFKELKGQLKSKWGKLTDDDLDVIDGKREQLLGKLQQLYGYKKDEAEKNVDDFLKGIKA